MCKNCKTLQFKLIIQVTVHVNLGFSMPRFRCKTTKKKIVMKRKKMMPSSHRRGNVTSVVALQRRRPLDKKAALKSKIQDILNGRLRFVIRKVPVRTKTSSTADRTTFNVEEEARVTSPPSVLRNTEDTKKDR